MRRIAVCMLCLLVCALLFPVSAHAVDTTRYWMEEIGLMLDLPNELVVLHREIDPDDPNLEFFSGDAQTLEDYFQKENIYLDAVSPDLDYEIFVSMESLSENAINRDLADWTATDMLRLEESARTSFQKSGMKNILVDQYSTPKTAYLRVRYEKTEQSRPVYVMQYSTIYGHRLITLHLHSYGQPISYQQETLFSDIASSAQYEDVGDAKAEYASTLRFPDARQVWAAMAAGYSGDQLRSTMISALILWYVLLLYAMPLVLYSVVCCLSRFGAGWARRSAILYAVVISFVSVVVCFALHNAILGVVAVIWCLANVLLFGLRKPIRPPEVVAFDELSLPARHSVVPTARYCTRCGAALKRDAAFCQACGTHTV